MDWHPDPQGHALAIGLIQLRGMQTAADIPAPFQDPKDAGALTPRTMTRARRKPIHTTD